MNEQAMKPSDVGKYWVALQVQPLKRLVN